MRFVYSFATIILMFSLAGCGGSSSPSTPVTPVTQQLTITSGNWDMLGSTSNPNGASLVVGGNISQSGSTISGTVRINGVLNNAICFDTAVPVQITGTVNGQSVTFSGTTAASQTITANVTGTATTLSGTYNISGTGCDSGVSGAISGNLVPSISGTWSGTLTSNAPPRPSFTLSAPIVESTTADATGLFALTGNATFAGSPCFTTGVLIPLSAIVGGTADITIQNNDGSSIKLLGNMQSSATPTHWTGIYNITGGTCNGDNGTATLDKQ